MSDVDQKIVEMRFDNEEFERGVQTTISSVDNLKNSLNFSDMSDTFSAITDSANSVDVSNLSAAIESLNSGFSALKVVGTTAISNITSSIMGLGKKIVSALVFEPITTGFEEYETQINATQTILANTQQVKDEANQTEINKVKETAEQETEIQEAAYEENLANLKETQSEELSEYQKTSDAKIDALDDQYEQESESLKEAIESEKESLSSAHESRIEELQNELSEKTSALDNQHEQELESLENLMDQELESLKSSHEQQLQLYKTNYEAQTKIVKEQYDAQIKALEKSNEQQTESLKKAHEQQLDSYENAYDKQLEEIEKSYDNQLDALEKSIDEEEKALEKSHNKKLSLYKEEYEEKLKLIDKERSEKIKAIEDEIAAIENLTKTEEEATEKEEQQKKLNNLQKKINNSTNAADRINAEKALAEYKEELSRKQTLKERKEKIAQLKSDKESINEQYDLKEDNAKSEYELKKEQENELYKQEVSNLSEQQALKKKNLKEYFSEQKKQLKASYNQQKESENELYEQKTKQLKENYSLQKEQLQSNYENQKSQLQSTYETQKEQENSLYEQRYSSLKSEQDQKKKNLEEYYTTQKAQIQNEYNQKIEQENATYKQQSALLSKQQSEKTKNLKEYYENEKEQIKASEEAFKEKQESELKAMEEQHKTALANIEEEKEAQISALKEVKTASKKGSTIEDVNAALDELNEYADKTIYNFTEMTRNIGTFTAAGVDLDTSVSAIKGIANLGAMSGSNSFQVSTAMYQLSQALAAGKVALQDWNSVTTAGMGGTTFQDALIRTSDVLGTGATEAIEKYGTFRESLSRGGWLTSEVLTETLKQFTMLDTEANRAELAAKGYTEEQIEAIIQMGTTATEAATKVKTFSQLWGVMQENAQSGWSASWRIIIGDFKEAEDALSKVSDTIEDMMNASNDARINMLQDWKELGGRTTLIKAIKEAFQGLVSIAKPLREAFREIFPQTTGKQLYDLTDKLYQLTSKMKINSETSENLKNTFKGLLAVIDIAKQAFLAIASGVVQLVGAITPAGGGILSLTGTLGLWISKADEAIKKTDIFGKAIDGLTSVVKFLVRIAHDGVNVISNFIKEIGSTIDISNFKVMNDALDETGNKMSQFAKESGAMKEDVNSNVNKIGENLKNSKGLTFVKNLLEYSAKLGKAIRDIALDIAHFVGDSMSNIDLDDIFNAITAFSIVGIFNKIKETIESIKSPFASFTTILESINSIFKNISSTFKNLTSISEKVNESLETLRVTLKTYQSSLKAGILLSIASAVGILVASIVALSLLDTNQLATSISVITALIVELMTALTAFSVLGGKNSKILKANLVMISMAISIDILASAMLKLANLNWEEVKTGVVGIAGLSAIIVVSMKALSHGSKKIAKGAANLITFAIAMKIIVSACEELGTLHLDELAKGLLSIGVLLTEISLFLNNTNLSGNKTITTAIGIVTLSSAIKILASVCDDFSDMPVSGIIKAIASIGLLLTELGIFINTTGNAKHIISTGAALVIMASSMKMLASVMDVFSGKSYEQIGKGLLTIGVALSEFSIALKAMEGSLSGAAALLIATNAILILTPALILLGNMSWTGIIKGLTALAGVFTILGVAGALLSPLSVTILALASSLTLIGIAIALAGAGILAAGIGLNALAGGITRLLMAIAAGTASLAGSLTLIVTGIIGLLPVIAKSIGETIVQFAKAIGNGIPVILKAISDVIKAVVETLVDTIPVVAENLVKLILEVLSVINQYAPKIADYLFDIMIKVLEVFSKRMPELVKVGCDLMINFLDALFTQLNNISADTVKTIEETLVAVVACFVILAKAISVVDKAKLTIVLMMALVAEIALIFFALAQLPTETTKTIADSLSETLLALSASMWIISKVPVAAALQGIEGLAIVVAGLTAIIVALGALTLIPGFTWLVDEGSKVLGDIGNAIGSFAGNIIGGFLNGVSSSFPQIGSDLAGFAENAKPFFETMKDVDEQTVQGAKGLAETILILTAAELLNGLTSWLTGGGSSIEQFGVEIANFGTYFKKYYETIKDIDGEVVEKSANAAKSLAQFAQNIPNTGGLVSLLTGDNPLSVFANELCKFGPSMKKYADSIKGIDIDTVQNSTTAAKSLAELARNLPNTGGLVSFFTGDNDIGTFGNKLVTFGQSFARYSTYMETVNSNVIDSTTRAAQSIAKLQKELPKEFLLTEFGKSLTSFGSNYQSYYNRISNIDTNKLSSVIDQTNKLVAMAKGMNNIDTKGMTSFGDALTELGRAGIKGFISAFDGAPDKIANKVNSMLKSAVRKIRSYYNDFYNAGSYVISGFSNGMSSYANQAAEQARQIASSAVSAMNNELNIHSPSKVTYAVGEYFGIGFVNALKDYSSDSYKAGSSIASSAKKGLTKAVSTLQNILGDDIDTQPVISPVLDLSNIQNGKNRLDSMMSDINNYGLNGTLNIANTSLPDYSLNASDTLMENLLNKMQSFIDNNNDKQDASVTFDNTFNITGDNPEDIAREVSRIIQKQVERKGMVWA